MGREWLNEIVAFLTGAGIRAMEAYPGQERLEIAGPVAAVSLNRMDLGAGITEFSVRVLCPRRLGAWECQDQAVQVMEWLCLLGMDCRMEQVRYENGCDCFCAEVLARMVGLMDAAWVPVSVNEEMLEGVTEFTAEQNRQRQFITGIGQAEPVGITPGLGGWTIRMVQAFPAGMMIPAEPAEPFELVVTENGQQMVYTGCGWNRVKQTRTGSVITLEWEGLALTRERR